MMMINHLILCLRYKNKRVQQEVMASKTPRGLEIVLNTWIYSYNEYIYTQLSPKSKRGQEDMYVWVEGV